MMDDMLSLPTGAASCPAETPPHTLLLYYVSVLRDKIQELESIVSIFLCTNQIRHDESTDTAISTAGSLAQDIIGAASSTAYALQRIGQDNGDPTTEEGTETDVIECDIVELDAYDLLAKYTHYCQVCGKGFKRDANRRMHMRAHGEEYKSISSSLGDVDVAKPARKYSCPHEGCRWNKRHPRFQPLKSMVCVKNHYKRSHCPKMYVCKRCNQKQFSVLSDLRTHEKHCGDRRWRCSCGNNFSRKEKLLGHITLFVGHSPII
ncbi:protein SENSITIVE TO PROTON RHIZOTOXICITY 2-like [Typha angustifolia]|uniref:protein SENSITIVE TO PROTON RHIZOTOXICITY 2-like n=1 Tax=Typha angustifolia TaxID=59011 RepID=UPI003C2DBC02